MKKKLFIYGVGRLAEYAAYVFKHDSEYEVEGFCIENEYLQKVQERYFEFNVYEDITDRLLVENSFLFIAVGNNIVRERIYYNAKAKGIKMASYISSKASIWDNIQTGGNCFIGEGSVIQPFVKIGDNTILFSARLGHHTSVGNHVLLSGPSIGGNVKIGDQTFIGMNAVIMQNLEIGARNIIGMGVAIKNSTEEGDVFSSPTFTKRNVNFDNISKNYLD